MADKADFEKDIRKAKNKIWSFIPPVLRSKVAMIIVIIFILGTVIAFWNPLNFHPFGNDSKSVSEQTKYTEKDYSDADTSIDSTDFINVAVCREIDSDWSDRTYIRNNELAECKITLTNMNNYAVKDSVISCVLTGNLEIVDSLGVSVFSNEHPDSLQYGASDLTPSGIKIQSVLPNESIDLVFYVKAVSEDVEQEESITGVVNINGIIYQKTAVIKIENPKGGWADSINGRREYTIEDINNGVLGDIITFNSISNSVIGHEFNFVGARKLSEKGVWNANVKDVEDGEVYVIRLYVHNNSPKGYDAIAKDVKTTFYIPQTASKEQTIFGYIDSSNAVPNQYRDSVTLKSDKYFYLEYINGSALLENNSIGKNGGLTLSDDITKAGILIGFNALDGLIPGCYEYSCYITIEVKVHVLE